MFVKFLNIEVRAVVDNQPLLGTGPRNLACRRARPMVEQDTFDDNLCITVDSKYFSEDQTLG